MGAPAAHGGGWGVLLRRDDRVAVEHLVVWIVRRASDADRRLGHGTVSRSNANPWSVLRFLAQGVSMRAYCVVIKW